MSEALLATGTLTGLQERLSALTEPTIPTPTQQFLSPQQLAARWGIPVEQMFLSPQQLAARWDIPIKTLEVWRYRGVGPNYVKFGKLVRYSVPVIVDHEQSCARTNTAQTGGGEK